MRKVRLRTGDEVEVREEDEPIPEGGSFVTDRNGRVAFVSHEDGQTTRQITTACQMVEEALRPSKPSAE